MSALAELSLVCILHADDLGATEAASGHILEAWQRGDLDGFSVIANGEALAEVSRGLAAAPQRPARIAAHLNLSEGPPCAGAGQVPLLVDDRGHLASGFASMAWSWLTGSAGRRREFSRQVDLEWRAQVGRVQDAIAPRQLSSIDGHRHVHMLPFLFPIAARIGRDLGIPEIRISREPYFQPPGAFEDLPRRWFLVNLVKHLVLRLCAAKADAAAQQAGLKSPSYLIGILASGHMSAEGALAGLAAAQRCGARRVEVLFHIGRASPGEAQRWQRSAELAFNRASERDQERSELSRLRSMLTGRGAAGERIAAP